MVACRASEVTIIQIMHSEMVHKQSANLFGLSTGHIMERKRTRIPASPFCEGICLAVRQPYVPSFKWP
jgi:hypothetical protein